MTTAAVITLLGLTGAQIWAQPAQSAVPRATKFEVGSIRPCKAGERAKVSLGDASNGRLRVCANLSMLIQFAYVVYRNGEPRGSSYPLPVPISGGPAWINSDLYEINAKAEGEASPEMMFGPLLQVFLEDRFQLKLHRETREVPVYALTIAKNGSKLRRSEAGGCVPLDLDNVPPPGQKPRVPFCGATWTGRKGPNLKELEMSAMTLDEFSKTLTTKLDRPVINRTRIAGTFDFHVEFAPDETTPGVIYPGDPTSDAPSGGPSIFTAVREQLGLKLEPAKGPGEFLVIDSVERPSEN